jgi:hypothetical protein
MTQRELLQRAHQYVTQAIERAHSVQDTPSGQRVDPGLWVSLQANLASALADLDTVLVQPEPTA